MASQGNHKIKQNHIGLNSMGFNVIGLKETQYDFMLCKHPHLLLDPMLCVTMGSD